MTLGGAAIAAEAGEVQAGEGPDLLTTVLFTATIAALVILTLGVSPLCSPVSLCCLNPFGASVPHTLVPAKRAESALSMPQSKCWAQAMYPGGALTG